MSVFINASGTKERVSHIFANIDGNKKKIVSAWTNKDGITTKVFDENKFEIINSNLYLIASNSASMSMNNSNYTTTWIPITYSADFINFKLVQCNDDKTSALYISKAVYEEKRISEIIYNPVLKTYFAHGITIGKNTSGSTVYGGRYFILSSKDGILWDTVFVRNYSYNTTGNIKLICNESNGDMIYVAANLTSSSSIFILHSSNGIEWESISPTITCDGTVNSFFTRSNFNPTNLTYLNDGYFYYSMEITSYKEDYSVLANYAFVRSDNGITWEPVYGYADSEFSIYFPNMTKVSSLYNAKKNTRLIKFNDIYLTVNTVEKDVMYSTDMITWNVAGITELRSSSSEIFSLFWTVFGDKLYLYITVESKKVCLFTSTNGINWSQETISYNGKSYLELTYSDVFYFSLVDFDDKYIIAFENRSILETQNLTTFEKNNEITEKISAISNRTIMPMFIYKVSKH